MVDPVVTDTSVSGAFRVILAQRLAAWIGAVVAGWGVANASDPNNMAGFTAIVSGILMMGSEMFLAWWRKKGMVMISAALARYKGIPLPHEEPHPPTTVVTPAGPTVIQVKSVTA
jgi:hypothetical protein